MAPRGETIAVVVPARDAEAYLDRSLPALRAAAGGADIVVVDDASRDGTASCAAAHGARVVVLRERSGPAAARNAGVAQVDADVVLFLDADCVPQPDVVKRVQAAFASEPSLVALSGSYTAYAPEPDFVSQYMNLRHHHTHQVARRVDSTFWTGCGAVRRRAFLAAGGFDAAAFPNGMEDMELGTRLARQGTLRLDPGLQVTHLKRWDLRSAVRADVLRRAVPWSRLLLERGHWRDDLNLRRSQRAAAVLAPLALLALPALPWALATGAWGAAGLAAAAIAASAVLCGPLLLVFARQGGPGFALRGWLFHQVHLVYSAATLAACAALRPWRRQPAAR